MRDVIYGYARVSTKGQCRDGNSLPDQESRLRESGCEKIYREAYTGTKMDRPEFTALLRELKSGDRLVVTKLDRFARTTSGGIDTIKELLGRGVSVHILNMGLIDNTPTGRLIITVLLAFAEFERDMIVERTQTGKAVARATKRDSKAGRPEKTLAAEEIAACREKILRGEKTVKECCEELGISRALWYKRIKAA